MPTAMPGLGPIIWMEKKVMSTMTYSEGSSFLRTSTSHSIIRSKPREGLDGGSGECREMEKEEGAERRDSPPQLALLGKHHATAPHRRDSRHVPMKVRVAAKKKRGT